MTEIETARLRHRMLSPHDLDALLMIVSDPDVMKYLGIEAGTIPSREETKTALEGMIEFWAQNGFGRWAVIHKEDGKLIGLCGFRLLDGTPELFYVFAKANWGGGLATEAFCPEPNIIIGKDQGHMNTTTRACRNLAIVIV